MSIWFVGFKRTVLFPGDDECSYSVVSALGLIVPQRCHSDPVPPVDQSHSRIPAPIISLYVWYPAGSIWAAPADCKRRTLAWRTGSGNRRICLCTQEMPRPAYVHKVFREVNANFILNTCLKKYIRKYLTSLVSYNLEGNSIGIYSLWHSSMSLTFQVVSQGIIKAVTFALQSESHWVEA